ncbi:MAG: hypothetical protein AB7S26_14515 [Sandaracinaceae bacterium]
MRTTLSTKLSLAAAGLLAASLWTAPAAHAQFVSAGRSSRVTATRVVSPSATGRVVAFAPRPAYVPPASTSTTLANGSLACDVTENTLTADATYEVRSAGRVVASGSCATPATLAVGTYDVTLTLMTALDRPQRTVQVTVPANATATASARFDTGLIEVRIMKDRAPAGGVTMIYRDGVLVGTIGTGLVAHLSPGRYDLTARYHLETKAYQVDLTTGMRRGITANF